MTPDIKAVLQLQDLDNRAAALQKEIAALPQHVARIEKTLESHIRKLEADKAALTANLRDRKRIEDDIKVHEQKASKLRGQMSEAKTNEQYRAFQHEIEYCQNEIRKSEDNILELMGEAEPLEKNVKTAETSLNQEKEQVDAEKERARKRTSEDQAFLNQVLEERKTVIAALNPKVSAAYERIRKKRGGIAVAEATSGRCSACQIALRPQFFQDLKRAEQLQFCETCGRILYYHPPVNLEHEMHQQPASG
ncbi:MAG: zinc ribbon domain-containing protein [Bryobacteraceae bacterium]